MRRPLVAGNWKMNGSIQSVKDWAGRFGLQALHPSAEVILCPPYVLLTELQRRFVNTYVGVGAQDVSEFANGAYTGEVSALMLKQLGLHYVIVGHSERRSLFGESDQVVAKKANAAISVGLTPIVCVGELLSEREAGQTEAVVARQLLAITTLLGDLTEKIVVAYEPVWAIGTGKTASPEQAQDVHRFIRQQLHAHSSQYAAKLRILYGGSVKANNARALFAQEDIDGGLIGGASLDPDEFAQICVAAG